MEGFVRGDIIVIEFPYSHLKQYKRRPVLILKVPNGEDLIVMQITSSSYEKSVEIPLNYKDFLKGGLKKDDEIILKKSIPESAILSERSFAKTWFNKEEDEAWKDL